MFRSELTITDLKKICGTHFSDIELYEGRRYYELLRMIDSIPTDDIVVGEPISLPIPFQFNAQHKGNKTGYGNHYHGEKLVSQGTYYGETTAFAIIGVVFLDMCGGNTWL
jgi:hypothetical protein